MCGTMKIKSESDHSTTMSSRKFSYFILDQKSQIVAKFKNLNGKEKCKLSKNYTLACREIQTQPIA